MFVGVKFAITVAMQAVVVAYPEQFGAPGFTGLAKLGLVPVTLPGPATNPGLLVVSIAFP
jgi:hypothetical protein